MKLNPTVVLATVALAAVLTSAPGWAQPAAKTYRIGIMINGPARPAFLDRFRDDFIKLGYSRESIGIEGKFAEGQIERHPVLAKQLVAEGVDIILALGGPAARAAKNATAEAAPGASSRIPVVCSIVTDPVALGLVASRELPGGNVTGVTSLDPQQPQRQLQLLREALPDLAHIAILSDDTIPGADDHGLAPVDRANLAAARDLGLEPHLIKLKGAPATDLEGAFAGMFAAQVGAVLVLDTPVPFAHQKRIGELAIAHRLPAIFPGGTGGRGRPDHMRDERRRHLAPGVGSGGQDPEGSRPRRASRGSDHTPRVGDQPRHGAEAGGRCAIGHRSARGSRGGVAAALCRERGGANRGDPAGPIRFNASAEGRRAEQVTCDRS